MPPGGSTNKRTLQNRSSKSAQRQAGRSTSKKRTRMQVNSEKTTEEIQPAKRAAPAAVNTAEDSGWISMSDDSDGSTCSRSAKAPAPQRRRRKLPVRNVDSDRQAGRLWAEQSKHNTGDFVHGKFTNKEIDKLLASVKDYLMRNSHGDAIATLADAENTLWRTSKGRGMSKAWNEIAAALPHRTIQACYYAAKRRLRPLKKGRWDDDEVAQLRTLVAANGGGEPGKTKWSVIGEEIGRSGEQCRDKWRDLKLGRQKAKGKWSAQEDALLRQLVTAHTPWLLRTVEASDVSTKKEEVPFVLGKTDQAHLKNGRWSLAGSYVKVPWQTISNELGSRTTYQCRQRWDILVKESRSNSKTSSSDHSQQTPASSKTLMAIEFLTRMIATEADDESELDFASIWPEELSRSEASKLWRRLALKHPTYWSTRHTSTRLPLVDVCAELRTKLENSMNTESASDSHRGTQNKSKKFKKDKSSHKGATHKLDQSLEQSRSQSQKTVSQLAVVPNKHAKAGDLNPAASLTAARTESRDIFESFKASKSATKDSSKSNKQKKHKERKKSRKEKKHKGKKKKKKQTKVTKE